MEERVKTEHNLATQAVHEILYIYIYIFASFPFTCTFTYKYLNLGWPQ